MREQIHQLREFQYRFNTSLNPSPQPLSPGGRGAMSRAPTIACRLKPVLQLYCFGALSNRLITSIKPQPVIIPSR